RARALCTPHAIRRDACAPTTDGWSSAFAGHGRAAARSDGAPHRADEGVEIDAFEHRLAPGRVEPEHAVSRVPARARLRDEPDRPLDTLRDRTEEIRPRREAIVARVAHDEEQRRAREGRALRPQVGEHPPEVRARVEIE